MTPLEANSGQQTATGQSGMSAGEVCSRQVCTQPYSRPWDVFSAAGCAGKGDWSVLLYGNSLFHAKDNRMTPDTSG